MSEPPVVCGVDVGVHHHGVAVVGSTVLYSATWSLPGPVPLACAALRARLAHLAQTTGVTAVAIEEYHGRGLHTAAEGPILLLTGAVFSLMSTVSVIAVGIQAWQDAIVGQRPVSRRDGGTSGLWKQTVRRRVELALQARGMRWQDAASDEGGHRYDALAAGLFLQDQLALDAQLSRKEPR